MNEAFEKVSVIQKRTYSYQNCHCFKIIVFRGDQSFNKILGA